MANSNGKITAPVRLHEDVRFVLGETALDVGNLCKSKNINKFAKYKPCQHTSFMPLTDALRYDINNGFTPMPIVINPYTEVKAETPVWGQWEHPKGLFRLGDFNGYNHKATPFVRDVYIESSHLDGESLILSTTHQGSLLIRISINPDADLKYSDFHVPSEQGGWAFGDYYMCAAIVFTSSVGSGENHNIYAYSKPLRDIETSTEDAIELYLQTAPIENPSLLDSVSEDTPAVLIIGLVRDTNSPQVFYSPIIFTEWEAFGWQRIYPTFKSWNGVVVRHQYYFVGGVSLEGTGYVFERVSPLNYQILLSGIFYYTEQTDSAGNTQVGSTTPIGAKMMFRLELNPSNGEPIIQEGEIDTHGNTHFFEGNSYDAITTLSFPSAGVYSGKLTLWVEGSTQVKEYIDGQPSLIEEWTMLGTYGDTQREIVLDVRINAV